MDIAALVTWILTALGGFFMLGTWISHGGINNGGSHLPVPVIFGHFALAAIGLVVWIVYLFADEQAVAWTGFGLLVPVALLGFLMLLRWLPTLRARVEAVAGGGQDALAEQHFPLAVVLGHGLLAVVTVVLVLLAALGIG